MANYNLPEKKRYKGSDATVGHPNDRVPTRKAGGAPSGTKMHTERTERKPSGQMQRKYRKTSPLRRIKG